MCTNTRRNSRPERSEAQSKDAPDQRHLAHPYAPPQALRFSFEHGLAEMAASRPGVMPMILPCGRMRDCFV